MTPLSAEDRALTDLVLHDEAVIEMNVVITFKLQVEAHHFISQFEDENTPLTPRNIAHAMLDNIPHDIQDICGPMSEVVVQTQALPYRDPEHEPPDLDPDDHRSPFPDA